MALLTQLTRRVRYVTLAGALAAGVAVMYYAQPAASASDAIKLSAANKTITGTVVYAAGKPVGNCPVKLISQMKAGAGPTRRGPNDSPTGDSGIGIPAADKLQKTPGSLGPGESVLKQGTTDSSGKFTFTDVPVGQYQIMAGTGKQATREVINVKDRGDLPPVTVKLKA